MAVAIDFREGILALTATGEGIGDVPALAKRVERLARGAGGPFGALLDLSAGRPADEQELAALMALILYELPDHGLRQLAMVLDGPAEAFDGLRNAVASDPDAAQAISIWSDRTQAEQHLRSSLGLDLEPQ